MLILARTAQANHARAASHGAKSDAADGCPD